MSRELKNRKTRKRVSLKRRKSKMLKSSEWILLGVFFVGISELLVNSMDLKWHYLPYAFAVCGVFIFKILLSIIRLFTRGTMIFLDRIKYM